MKSKNEPFFTYHTALLLVIVVSGFTIASFRFPNGVLDVPLFLHFHGAAFLGWYALLLLQMHLIRINYRHIHKFLGFASVIYAIAIIVIGYIVVADTINTPDKTIAGRPAQFGAIFPITDILNFTLAFTLGVLLRANSQAHKRFMLMTGIFMIDAAMARLIFGLGLPGILIWALEISLILMILIYDFIRFKKPHWATVVGFTLYGLGYLFKSNIEQYSWWPNFIEAIF
jgi:hypothetical protein